MEVIDFPNPGKFELTGYTHSAIKPLPASHQTLINPSIDYNGTHTTLRYKQPFEEAGQLSISATKENIAIFGIGSATGFQGVHVYNGAFPITLSKCSTVDGENTRAKLFNNETPKSDLWKIHGYIMAVAWGVMFPLGIGSSLLRRIIPGDHTWFTFHLMFNCLVSHFFFCLSRTRLAHDTVQGVILTTGGFGLAIIAVIDEGNVHFNTTHKVIGLLVGIVTLLQSGLSLCSQAALVAKEELDKEQVFHYWGIIHRLIGTTLLIFGWWNCHSGIVAFSDRYGDYDKDLNTMVFWFVAGGLAFIILFMRAMAQLFRI